MAILNQNKVRLINDETSMRNPYYSSGIYLTAAKVAKCRLVADNMKEKEEAKRETAKKTAKRNFYLQKSDVKIFRNTRTP